MTLTANSQSWVSFWHLLTVLLGEGEGEERGRERLLLLELSRVI